MTTQSIEWFENAISKHFINKYNYDDFYCRIVDEKISVYEWKNHNLIVVHKSLKHIIEMKEMNEKKIKALVKELRLLQQVCSFPNIIKLYGLTKDPYGDYHIVLQYADDGNLREYLEKNFSVMKWTDKLRTASEIAQGLMSLHEHNIIHKSFHSKNILIHQGQIMISDSGLTKKSKQIASMPAYFEPQCLQKNSNYELDKKSDIYSLGVILWEISSGIPPFKSYSPLEILFFVSDGEREMPAKNTPNRYIKLYSLCWDQCPSKRPEIKTVCEVLKMQYELALKIEKAYKNTNYNNNMANKTSKDFNDTLISQTSSNTLISKASSMKSTDTLVSRTSMNSSNTSINTVKRNSRNNLVSKALTVLNDSKSQPDNITVNEHLNNDLRSQSYKVITNNKNENFYDEISKKPDKIVSQSEAYTIYDDKSIEDKSIDEITLMSDNVSLSDSSIYSVPGITSLLEDFEIHDINIQTKLKLPFILPGSLLTAAHSAEIASWIDNKSIIYNVNNIPYEFKLIFKGSKDGFSVSDFHKLCDNKSMTVLVIKVSGSDEILGGFNPLEWKSVSNKYAKTDKSFIFSFKNNKSILSRVKNENKAIYYDNDFGPSFGGSNDLFLVRNLIIRNKWSCKHKNYSKAIRDSEGYFKVDEFEVFEICENRFNFS
ncbi:kinase-like domain-containing protein [Gigaspora rosea]|uniref:Kinase-like domain-containing protein n=1 Tax=Gigaspora rosea TaxID=44941 RepID=A0A397UD00_9GLOM|nr:kinase-like domain-containing protein [Gigaspora rosea]